ncbi:MAG: glycosyltransferase, partial [Verrucomicrobiota bacterium]
DSWAYADQIARLGWTVDVIDWDDRTFVPTSRYDAVISIDGNGLRLAEMSRVADSRLILHLTTADPGFNNTAESQRLAALLKRRGARLRPRRQLEHVLETTKAMSAAHSCLLIGNAWALSTYPNSEQSKIHMTNVVTSARALPTDSQIASKPFGNEYLWLFGGGAVHKGLDLTLEAFAAQPQLKLHVVGNLENELDFLKEYRRELFGTQNIKYHGFLRPNSPELQQLLNASTYSVAPSCSEGMSTAVAFTTANGLVPIHTREVGMDFDNVPHFEILSPTVEAVSTQIEQSALVDSGTRRQNARTIAAHACTAFSRDAYQGKMKTFLDDALRNL